MDFVNETGLPADWTLGHRVDRRERLIVIVKATYLIPERGVEPPLADVQSELVAADEYWGEPGVSAPKLESDYAHFKPRCDVILNGTAYTPGGIPRTDLRVSLHVGRLSKAFFVIGDRTWQRRPLLGAHPGEPGEFTAMPIRYDCAFGGRDESDGPEKIHTFFTNPIGRGFRRNMEGIGGQPLPNTEELLKPVRSPRGNYQPMAFGPVGRNWGSRPALAGTYDQRWIETRAPFFPDDFDDAYFQAAPPDQQMPYPEGGERVALENLSSRGNLEFHLPRDLYRPVIFGRHDGSEETIAANVDTIVFEPDAGRFTLTWRAVVTLRRNAFEIYEVIVGPLSMQQRRARRVEGKVYYANLTDLVTGRSTDI
jgi:hypothetical protein